MQVELVKCCGISHDQYLQLVIQQHTHEVREEQEMGVNFSLFLKILQLECEKKSPIMALLINVSKNQNTYK